MINCDIVIVDSGLNLNENMAVPGVYIQRNGEEFVFCEDLTDMIGHGTIIYSVISKQVKNAKFFIVKLPEAQNNYDESCLIEALKYIKNNINCKIINMSLGVKAGDRIKELYNLCKEISSTGVVVISAFDNDGSNSYPAAFECVIGVDSKKNIKQTDEFEFVENSKINVLAKGNVQRLVTPDGRVLLVSGSSIACAHISSFLANAMIDDMNIQNSLLFLRSKAKYIHYSTKKEIDEKNKYFSIDNAIVFPFSKEAHAFLRFSDMLPFKIHKFYDVRYSGKVGRKLTSYYENAKSESVISDVEKIDFTDIDTIILGHLDEINAILGRDYRAELIRKAISSHVNIYSFDPLDLYTDLLRNSEIKYFYPIVTQTDVPQNSFGKLYNISKPVVGIFGTSSQQGKFSLQLALKRGLELEGYSVGTIGTEPHSLLFDFDAIFPMGYNSTVRLLNSEIVLYLNSVINELCLRGKEVILVSTQAQIVPYSGNNLLEIPIMQYHFAIGTRPDAIVMCVNYYDEIGYIKNSVYALSGLTDASIIAFVLFPVTYSNDLNIGYGSIKRIITDEEFTQKKKELQNEFQLPVYILGDVNHMHRLCKEIIDFF